MEAFLLCLCRNLHLYVCLSQHPDIFPSCIKATLSYHTLSNEQWHVPIRCRIYLTPTYVSSIILTKRLFQTHLRQVLIEITTYLEEKDQVRFNKPATFRHQSEWSNNLTREIHTANTQNIVKCLQQLYHWM